MPVPVLGAFGGKSAGPSNGLFTRKISKKTPRGKNGRGGERRLGVVEAW